MISDVDIYDWAANEVRLVAALADGEDAKDLMEFASLTRMSVDEVSTALDSLVAKGVLGSDTSYHKSDFGTIVYMFVDNELSQYIYDKFVPESFT